MIPDYTPFMLRKADQFQVTVAGGGESFTLTATPARGVPHLWWRSSTPPEPPVVRQERQGPPGADTFSWTPGTRVVTLAADSRIQVGDTVLFTYGALRDEVTE